MLEFTCDWHHVVFLHYSVEPDQMFHRLPFEPELRNSRAILSLVAFEMKGFRLRQGGAWTRWITRPIADYALLNLRTYVRYDGERGIFFLREWVSSGLASRVSRMSFGLPYVRSQIAYRHADSSDNEHAGLVRVPGSNLSLHYRARLADPADRGAQAAPGSLEHFCLEQYVAFTSVGQRARRFRIHHEPWRFVKLHLEEQQLDAAVAEWPTLRSAEFISAQYVPELLGIRIERPKRLRIPTARLSDPA